MATVGHETAVASPSFVYQFKVTLQDTRPKIWRQIQIPESFTFWDFHCAIQDAMGWNNCHPFTFDVGEEVSKIDDPLGISIGIPLVAEREKLRAWETLIVDQFCLENNTRGLYEYDPDDSWIHEVILEKVLPVNQKKKYPLCVGGKRACPPEECGGVKLFAEHLKIVKNQKHPKYEEKMDWLQNSGYEDYNPGRFKPSSIKFMNDNSKIALLEFHK